MTLESLHRDGASICILEQLARQSGRLLAPQLFSDLVVRGRRVDGPAFAELVIDLEQQGLVDILLIRPQGYSQPFSYRDHFRDYAITVTPAGRGAIEAVEQRVIVDYLRSGPQDASVICAELARHSPWMPMSTFGDVMRELAERGIVCIMPSPEALQYWLGYRGCTISLAADH